MTSKKIKLPDYRAGLGYTTVNNLPPAILGVIQQLQLDREGIK